MMTPSKSTPTQRFVSGLWTTIKTSSSPTTVAKKKIERPSANFAERQKRQSRPPSCVLPGFQESLLAQMEQLNSENKNDPKAQRLLNLKRQSIRKSLAVASTETPNSDDYDWEFWTTVICEFDQMKKSKEFNNQIRKGIPPSLRGMIWQSLANVKQLDLKEDQHYIELLKATSPYDKMIQRDLARSFPDHDYFKDKNGVGQEGLYNVVRAYSVYDAEVGYCQGLNFIVGPLLLNMPDEEAFSVLVQLMNQYGLRGHFTPSMEGLHLKLYQFDALVAEHLPHISRHLKRRGIDPTMYASQWFMTLFAYKFPLDIVFRIYDIVFTEGTEAILKFSLALLKKNEAHILELDFEQLLHFLKNGLFEEYMKSNSQKEDDGDAVDDCHRQLVNDACQWDIPRKRLLQLEKEHKAQTLKEEQDAKLLESLQKQQASLQQQVDQFNTTIENEKKEHHDLCTQLQDSQQHFQHMKDEQVSLQTVVTTLKEEVDTIAPKIEHQYKEQFDQLCDENTALNQRNAQLEDQLSSLEAILIDMKMRYAQSENERDELSKKFYELKKIFGQN
ncbi:rab-GTPase-TBC domain-containing protein [Cunninghamella echinulata]|nr:rab-GTPase-TBC domain-containing protein [Cunninghamella echinulata]